MLKLPSIAIAITKHKGSLAEELFVVSSLSGDRSVLGHLIDTPMPNQLRRAIALVQHQHWCQVGFFGKTECLMLERLGTYRCKYRSTCQ